jgi:murein DD-endopeptidase MepM/ murein hydrolase activator NlpD
MKKLLKATSAMVMGLSFLAPLPTLAIDYTQKFAGTTTGSGTVNLATPTIVVWDVISKYNQPRIVPAGYTNPHQGTDLATPYGTTVYPIERGWVTDVRNSEHEVDIQLDINGDGIKNDNVYVRYDHLADIFVQVGDYVTPVTIIAYSGNEGGQVGAHLHFGVMKQDAANTGRPDYWVRTVLSR